MSKIYRTEKGRQLVLNYYEQLQIKHPEIRKKYVDTSFGKTFVVSLEKKGKQPLILLHGSSSNSAMWFGEMDKWGENYSIYAIDIPGECGKSIEHRLSFKNKEHSKWLKKVVEQLNLDHFSIAGNSLGAYIGTEMAIHHSHYVKELILISPGGIVPVKISAILYLLATSILGKVGFKLLSRKIYSSADITEEAWKYGELIHENFIPRTDPLPVFTSKQLSKIKALVFLIAGQNDFFYSMDQAHNKLRNSVANYTGKLIENQGHIITRGSSILCRMKQSDEVKRIYQSAKFFLFI